LLFIEEGQMVQIKSRKKEKNFKDKKKIEWDATSCSDGKTFSASASEILAAAIRLQKGIIIKSKQTYGKGTVQNVIDLNQFVRSSTVGDLGALKTTTQKIL
jgi:carboxyl-terminal processing protease